MAISPSQNEGVEYSSKATTDNNRSCHLPARADISTPSSTPAQTAMPSAVPISSSVLPSRSRISCATGALWRGDMPRSNCAMPVR